LYVAGIVALCAILLWSLHSRKPVSQSGEGPVDSNAQSEAERAAAQVAAAIEKQRAAQSSLDYNDLALVVSEPVFDGSSVDNASSAYADGGVMSSEEYERQQLNNLRELESQSQAAREQIAGPLVDCYNTYQEIRRLDSNTPDYEGLVRKAIEATPALIEKGNRQVLSQNDQQALNSLTVKAIWEIGGALVNSIRLSSQRDDYATHYNASRRTIREAMAGLVAQRYAASPSAAENPGGGGVIDIELTPSLADTYCADIIALRNDSGKDLGACTLFINLAGIRATTNESEEDSHFHYVSSWPAGQPIYLWYPSRSLQGIATNQSVDVINKVEVSIYSDDLTTTASQDLTGGVYDDIVKQWAEKHLPADSFNAKWWTKAELWWDPAGFEVTYNGDLSSFTVKQIVVEAVDGDQSVRVSDNSTDWRSSEKKWICDPNFNSIDPRQVKVTISFPGTSYEHVITWTLR
jgi:hypothetical protein